jgi:hypothetical protein
MRSIPEFNFPAFDRAARHLEEFGHEVFNPADRDRSVGFTTKGMTGDENLAEHGFDLREALAADTEWISLHAEAIALLPGWEKSTGAAAEVALARALGLPVALVGNFGVHGPTEVIPSEVEPSGALKAAVEFAEVELGKYLVEWTAEPVASFGRNTSSTKPAAGEVRTTSSTGGQKGQKLAQMSSLDPHALSVVAEVAGFGAQKYSKLNFMKGYDWSLSYDALQRHLHAFWNGQDRDDESGLLHLGHAAWHCLAMISFFERGLGTDDRYSSTPELADLQTKELAR